ncbi:MAG: TonB-dependent receptor [Bacteroidales bacterium]|nr:TonB-dependent receptor [Bacteroidales bacterium]
MKKHLTTMKKIFTLFVLLFSMQMMQAQVTTASMAGRVIGGGETLPGATIRAVHTPTGTVFGSTTRMDGSFTVPNMRIGGPYTVEISFMGFQPQTFTDIFLTLGEEFTLNVTLVEGIMLEGVDIVSYQSAVMNSSRTGAQTVVTRNDINMLPTSTRSLSDFTRLTPMSASGGGTFGTSFAGVSGRFNNMTVNGASFNNSFGLGSGLGGAGREPISLEALDQIQVMIAPFDVRLGGFTGGGINTVTRSGTNDFHAAAYMFTRSPALMGYRVGDQIQNVAEFSDRSYGVTVSGAIIPNRLFFFVNAEVDRQASPISFTTRTPGSRIGAEGEVELDRLADFLRSTFGYDPGFYNKTSSPTEANRITARFDFNINPRHRLSLSYYHLRSFSTGNPSTSQAPVGGRGPNLTAIPFSSTFFRFNNNFDIVMAELHTTINNRMSNTLQVGYSRLRDFRDMDGGFFPQVDILMDGQGFTTFGTEANSLGNRLDSDIFQIQNNFVINTGRHEITLGTQSDLRRFKNGFAQNYPGAWVFGSVDDFIFNSLATQQWLQTNPTMAGFNITNFNPAAFGITAPGVTGIANSAPGTGLTAFNQAFSVTGDFPFAFVDVFQIGLYAQNRWRVNDQFNLTFGVRVDIPIFTTDLPENPAIASDVYLDGIQIDVSRFPNAQPMFSPRVGFNWRPLEDGSLQVRGGTGIFTGTPPYVWLSNQASNNGLVWSSLQFAGDRRQELGFTGDIYTYPHLALESATLPRANINATDPNFRFPSIWRNNLAADFRFGGGWIATVELIHSSDINAIYHRNIGVQMAKDAEGNQIFVNDGSGQNRRPAYIIPQAGSTFQSDLPGNSGRSNHVILMGNSNLGYSIFSTFQLQRNFMQGPLQGLSLNASYTMGRARGINDGTGSVALSSWNIRRSLDPNAAELGTLAGSVDGRFMFSGHYTANWSDRASTSIGIFFQRYRPYRFTFSFGGDANGSGIAGNGLLYIPRSLDEIRDNLDPRGFADIYAAWAALDAFIEQDEYLRTRRGQFTERGGAVAPWASLLDFSLSHSIHVAQGNGRRHSLTFSLDIHNFLNLLNPNWGVHYSQRVGTNGQNFEVLQVTQVPTAANDFTVRYALHPSLVNVQETFQPNVGSVSRWAAMFGVRYSF